MQIVIDIPEKIYKNIQSGNFWLDSGLTLSNAFDLIKNGAPLPKGHGDLIDRDAVNSRYDGIYAELDSLSNKPTFKVLLDKLSMCLDTEKPIIEADGAESEEV